MVTRRPGMSTMNLFDARQGRKPDPRRIIGKDNLGEPIYEGEGSTGGGISIFGLNVQLDPVTASGIVFIIIAAQFFGVGLFQND